MASFETVRAQSDNRANVRKALKALVFLAPISADPITTLVSEDKSLAAIPAEYKPVGLINESVGFAREADKEETTALGYKAPVREDWTTDISTITLNLFEVDKRNVAELVHGIDLSAVTPDANGEIKYDVPEITSSRQYRLLALSQDINKSNGLDIYRGRFYANVELSSFPSEEWGSDAVSLEIELTARPDEETGVIFTPFLAGPGLDPTDLGYTAPVGG